MKASKFRQALDEFAHSTRASVFTKATLARTIMRGERPEAVAKTLAAATADKVIVRLCRGLYVYEQAARVFRRAVVEEAVLRLRPRSFNYLSLEWALHQWGVINQAPLGGITVMSTGRSQLFTTPYGRIEITHTAKRPKDLLGDVVIPDPLRCELPYAKPRLATAELVRVGRNVDLILWDEVAAAEREMGR